MRIINTFSGNEFYISEEEEAQIIKIKSINDGKAFIKLRDGSYLDTSAIESITGVPEVLMAHGRYPLNADGKSYMREGDKIQIEDWSHVVSLPDPKYKKIEQSKLLKLK